MAERKIRAWPRTLATALCLMFALLAGRGAGAAALPPGVERAPAPGFVRMLAVPAPRESRLRQVDGGSYDLLYDTQVRIDGGVETTYRRQVYKVVNRSGVESAAQQRPSFDPSHEKLVIHDIRIFRDGRSIDLTGSVDVDSIRRESELDDGVVTGVRTVVLRLPDVRVGDIIDTSWSWVSRPPLWPGHYFGTGQLAWSVPVEVTHFRIDLPSATPAVVIRYRGAPPPAIVRAAGRTVYDWKTVDPDPIEDQKGTPDWFQPWQRVSLSTMRGWGEVVDWALPLYRGADTFPSALEGEAARIEREGGSPQVRTIKALRLVQDKIRYTSMSIGAGSYAPRRPDQVVRQGWGDCKDKAQLLVALLRRLDIDAWPALTDTRESMAIDRVPPAPLAFNHVVVQARIGARIYWLDPTIDHQGGTLANLAPLPYRKALPLRPGQKRLEAIPLSPLAAPDSAMTETYRIDGSGIRLDVETVHTGLAADRMRADFARQSLAGKERQQLRYYADRYAGLSAAASLKTRDDRDRNRFLVSAAYFLPAGAYADGKLLHAFPIYASMADGGYEAAGGGRTQPLELPFPINRFHEIVLITPGFTVAPPEDVDVDGEAFGFTRDSERQGDRLTIRFSLVGKRALIEPQDFARYAKEARQLDDNRYLNLDVAPAGYLASPWRWAGLGLGGVLLILVVAGVSYLGRRGSADASATDRA